MQRALRIASRLLIVGLALAAADGPVAAQSREQDRRIEEGKREDLRATAPALPAATPTRAPVAGAAPAPIPEVLEPLYFASLVGKRITYRYDAMMGVLIVLGLDEEHIGLDSQVAFFQEQGFVPPRYRESFDPMQPLRRGLAAYMFRQALGIRGGLALHLLGPSERYALKELGFQGIMSPGLVNDLVSGQELVQIITQAANYQAAHLAKQQP